MHIASSARRHGFGRRRIEEAMARATLIESLRSPRYDEAHIRWIGRDGRGIEVEIIAVVLPDLLLVIHCMPTSYRRRST